MWKCPKCGETFEDEFDVCWNCGTTEDGTEDLGFRADGGSAQSTDAKDPQARRPPAASRWSDDEMEDKWSAERMVLRRISTRMRIVSLISATASAAITLLFYVDLCEYLYQRQSTEFSQLLRQVSVIEILRLSGIALALALGAMAAIVWGHAETIRGLADRETEPLERLLSVSERLWSQLTWTVAICIVIAVSVTAYLI